MQRVDAPCRLGVERHHDLREREDRVAPVVGVGAVCRLALDVISIASHEALTVPASSATVPQASSGWMWAATIAAGASSASGSPASSCAPEG